MVRFSKMTDLRPLAGALLLAGSLGGLVAGCGSSGETVPQATPIPDPAPEITPEANPEPAPEITIEDAPEELIAVVAARPQSDALKAAIADLTAAERARTNPFDGKPVEDGEADYTLLCAACHGATGQGGGPASVALGGTATNLLESAEGESLTEGERFVVLKHGIGDTHMQDFGAARSDAQLWKILAHLSSLR